MSSQRLFGILVTVVRYSVRTSVGRPPFPVDLDLLVHIAPWSVARFSLGRVSTEMVVSARQHVADGFIYTAETASIVSKHGY